MSARPARAVAANYPIFRSRLFEIGGTGERALSGVRATLRDLAANNALVLTPGAACVTPPAGTMIALTLCAHPRPRCAFPRCDVNISKRWSVTVLAAAIAVYIGA